MATTSTIKLVQFALLFQLVLSLVSAEQNATVSDKTASIFSSAQGVKAGGTVIALLALSAGGVVCFAGYKFMRPTLFVEGFMIGGVFVAIITEAMFKNQSYVATASWIAFMIGGIFGGLAVLSMYKVSIFMTGATAGVVLAIMINTSFGYKICPSEPLVSLVVIAVPSAWWAYMAIILVVFVIGMVVQFHKTACDDEFDHKSGVSSRESAERLPEFTTVETPPKEGYMLFGNPIPRA
ncbi:hypothetical protein PybrP1_011837 [[Pythium] brassicae (nom. inval.)]|nr:hypothetical protein PybrP1_011837 [[Pythium] brassicae (nom. inval.)]